MARRRNRLALTFAQVTLLMAKLASVIALQTMALIIWNVGARDPLKLVRDLFTLHDFRTIVYGFASLTIGLMFIAAATMVIISIVSPIPHVFVPIEMFTFVVAIGVDALIGNEVRRAVKL